MAAIRLKGTGNLADEIVDVLFANKQPTEMVKIAKSLLDNALNNEHVDEYTQAQMVVAICWEHGLNPPEEIKKRLW